MRIDVRADANLYRLIVAEADRLNVSLGEVLTMIAAQHFGKPELGTIAKAKPGPKPGNAKAEHAGAR